MANKSIAPAAQSTAVTKQDGGAEQTNGDEGAAQADAIFTLTVKLPAAPGETKVHVTSQEQVQDLRQSIVDQPFAMQYTCFHLEHNGERINDFVELGDVPGISTDTPITLVEDPYNEKEARMHVMRIRELIGAAGDRTDTIHGISAGLSLHDSLTGPPEETNGNAAANGTQPASEYDLSGYAFDGPGSVQNMLLPPQPAAPKTIKSISISPYNPPPYHLRTIGHLLYLLVTTNEGDQFHITSHVSGFFVSKSSNNKFDPFPKAAPKDAKAHSLLTLLQKISPSFESSFQALLEHNSQREPLALFQLQNAIPASPWLVERPSTTADHQADIARTQETFLMAGQEGTDTLRDWNEEFQTTRELPTETVQDKVFRERLTSKLFADYNEAAVRGSVLVARGEVPALNPTEGRDAQIFVYNNIFFSFGADGVGTFATEGGDEAARVATGKDVAGVRQVNQLDIKGLFTPGTVVVDYLGKRIVAQSIVPGIFKQQEPGEHQIDYGGVEGKDIVAENEAFVPLFQKLSGSLHVKKHAVWDKEGKRHDLEGSVETKGLIGTDARKYALDLYRITPLDVPWIEQHWGDEDTAGQLDEEKNYPHRMTVLRPELIGAYAREKLNEYVRAELAKKAPNGGAIEGKKTEVNGHKEDETAKDGEETAVARKDEDAEENAPVDEVPRVDMTNFNFSLNPDVFAGQKPQTEEEIAEMQKDEADVRAACAFLTTKVIPGLIHDLQEQEVGFPMDGDSLSTLLHKRGINIRYLGEIAKLSATDSPRLQALHRLAVQEMVSRAFKHIASKKLRELPFAVAPACFAHLLNCLLGTELNSKPQAEIDSLMRSIYTEADFSFEKVTPESLRADIASQVSMRYRYTLPEQIVDSGKEIQVLRDISLKLGLQLVAKDYAFRPQEKHTNGAGDDHSVASSEDSSNAPAQNVAGKKKNKKAKDSLLRGASPAPKAPSVTFRPEDILNIVAVVKEASPRSVLAEEAYEGGRISLAQDQKELGQELLMESLSLYEQIYGILHPEVGKTYLQMATLYYSMDEKNAAVELARKAVIVFERTTGVDSSDTISAYLNLALFEHGNGNSKLALTYVHHCLELWKIVYGPDHPDSITTLNNAAVMLQSMKRYHESRVWFEASLAIAEKMSGKTSVSTGTLLFQLAQALVLDRDHHAAVNRMRECCNIFRAALGPEDRNTKEAEQWLEQLTQNAVTLAKRQKDIASGKIRTATRFTNRIPIGARPQPQVGLSNADASAKASGNKLDSRSIEELVKYIDGDQATKKKTSGAAAKKRSANPKAKRTAAKAA
jgi:protein TIF31